MSQGELSIGDDTPTGEPECAPKGPYTTDETDDEMRREVAPLPSRTETEITRESDLGSDRGSSEQPSRSQRPDPPDSLAPPPKGRPRP